MFFIIRKDFLYEIRQNRFLNNALRKMMDINSDEEMADFIEENPDVVQMMLHLSQDDRLKVFEIEEEESE